VINTEEIITKIFLLKANAIKSGSKLYDLYNIIENDEVCRNILKDARLVNTAIIKRFNKLVSEYDGLSKEEKRQFIIRNFQR